MSAAKKKNPFDPSDPRHGKWDAIEDTLKEYQLRANSELMSGNLPAEPTDIAKLGIDILLQKFEVEAGAIHPDVGIISLDDAKVALDRLKQAYLDIAKETMSSSVQPDDFMPDLDCKLSGRVAYWEFELIKAAREMDGGQARVDGDNTPPAATSLRLPEKLHGKRWEDISIHFIDGHVIRLEAGETDTKLTYAELGFKDGRNANPNFQWQVLQELAKARGRIPEQNDLPDYLTRAAYKKKQAIRKQLKQTLGLDGDPFLNTPDTLYHVRFKISGNP